MNSYHFETPIFLIFVFSSETLMYLMISVTFGLAGQPEPEAQASEGDICPKTGVAFLLVECSFLVD